VPSKRFAFVSALWSFLPGALVILLFALTDIDLYQKTSQAAEGYQSLFFFAPIILLLFVIYHTIVGYIQTTIKQPKFLLALLSSIVASVPFPLLVALSKSNATQDERLALVLTALVIFGLFWLSLFTGSCYQCLKIKGHNQHGT
jgi:ABC-type amino acid transport system permease subunit